MRADAYSRDVVEFLRLAHEHGLRYLLVGGEAVIHHGYPRFTEDVDLFYDRTEENAQCLWRVLQEFWDGDVPVVSGYEELLEPGLFLQYGRPPNRLDLISTLGTVDFAAAWDRRHREPLPIDGVASPVEVPIIGLADLRQSKRDAGRAKDLDDLEQLPDA